MTAAEARLHAAFPVYGGVTPAIANATAEDRDNADGQWSAGDFITVSFDMATDRAASAGDKAFVDRLLRIDPPLGTGRGTTGRGGAVRGAGA